MHESIKVFKEDSIDIISGDHPDYDLVKAYIQDVSVWSVYKSVIVKSVENNLYYEVSYSEIATEQ